MIELTLKTFLEETLKLPVFFTYPKQAPERFVLIEKLGSSKINHLDDATFAFQSYGKTLYETARLNQRVKQAVEQTITLPHISRVQLNSDYNFTDEEMKDYRYQAVYDIYYYEEEI